jgi:quinol monooxygenase YgiN
VRHILGRTGQAPRILSVWNRCESCDWKVVKVIQEHASFRVAAESRDEFERAFAADMHHLDDADGCMGVELHRSIDQVGAYVMRVTWRNLEDHVEKFLKSPAAQSFAAALEPFLEAPPEVVHLEGAPVLSSS